MCGPISPLTSSPSFSFIISPLRVHFKKVPKTVLLGDNSAHKQRDETLRVYMCVYGCVADRSGERSHGVKWLKRRETFLPIAKGTCVLSRYSVESRDLDKLLCTVRFESTDGEANTKEVIRMGFDFTQRSSQIMGDFSLPSNEIIAVFMADTEAG